MTTPPRRHATLYDAVAGRITARSTTNPTTPKSLTPEEVLFRRANAPTRYEESDPYAHDQHLAAHDQRHPTHILANLPDSDLLKALHAYAADYYACTTGDGGERDWRSLDETALMALGVLVEEAAREAVGATGDLALVEGEGVEERGAVGEREVAMGLGCVMTGVGVRGGVVDGREKRGLKRRKVGDEARAGSGSDGMQVEDEEESAG